MCFMLQLMSTLVTLSLCPLKCLCKVGSGWRTRKRQIHNPKVGLLLLAVLQNPFLFKVPTTVLLLQYDSFLINLNDYLFSTYLY